MSRSLEPAQPIFNPQPQTSLHWSLMGFFLLVLAFNLCLNAQVLTVGLAYFYNPQWWKAHVWLVRSYSGLSLILYGMGISDYPSSPSEKPHSQSTSPVGIAISDDSSQNSDSTGDRTSANWFHAVFDIYHIGTSRHSFPVS